MSELKLFEIGNQVGERISSEVLLEKELQILIEKIWNCSLGSDF